MIPKPLGLAGCLLLVAAGCGSDARAARSPWAALWPGLPVTEVRAAGDGCVPAPGAAPGEQVLAVTNTSAAALELRIVLPDSPAAVFEIEPVGPATTRAQPVRLAPGRYRYACYFEERRVMYSDVFAVAGAAPAAGGPDSAQAVLPVSVQDLDPAVRAYERWVAEQLPRLGDEARRTASGGEAGRAGWLAAHRRYETLGAAYDAFGDAGKAVEDAFAKSEAALWPGQERSAGGDPAAAGHELAEAVDALAKDFPSAQVDPLDLGLRAHEIVEDSIEKTLTGRDDHGSRSMLATLAANLDGVRELLDLLGPLLRPRLASLDQLRGELDAAGALVSGTPRANPLAQAAQQRLNAAFGQLAEHLAKVAAICDVRRSR
ncbi:MAG: EfeM/EfeO family lipoprotein [Segniliparus sp.]|uniref:EfeM/EfeO family lipoprotein n=1 Tax=Segniliparus sp. TaxID=2804064 RepID=UPI003F2FEF46